MWEHLHNMWEHLWKGLHNDREIIINALDLISFVFVTPELAKFVNVGAAMLVSGIVSFIVMFILFTSVSYSFYLLFPGNNSTINSMALLVMIIIYAYIFFSYRKILLSIYLPLSRGMFFLGVAMFFVSRLLALSLALYGD